MGNKKIQVFKFGGVSVNSAKSILNVSEILQKHSMVPLVVVVSAMGKTTNALEKILDLKINELSFETEWEEFRKFHFEIASNLFSNEKHRVFERMNHLFEVLSKALIEFPGTNYDEFYDQVIPFGELLSTSLLSEFLLTRGINCRFINATKMISTDNCFREAEVKWDTTCRNINKEVGNLSPGEIVVTQGFIAGTEGGQMTTLGREGSDFSAAIFACCLNSKRLTVWKDVPGIMNADPKLINDVVMFKELSYTEASEMTYYGAKVIHPDTIKPLAEKSISLFVKSFVNPSNPGTHVHDCKTDPKISAIIYKSNQVLLSFRFTDFRFVNEQSLIQIYDVIDKLNIHVNMMQNSAISFSICFDFNQKKVKSIILQLKNVFTIHFNTGLTLLTIKNYTESTINLYKPNEAILLEQKSRADYQAVYRE